MQLVALTLLLLWLLSLWLLMVGQRRPGGALLCQPLALMSGTLLFFLLSLSGVLFLRLLFAD
ncbi:MAG TPA: hypothetical protein VKJ47_17025 [Candidatus Binatia bacterium]|nr:hypothetical protein [Candidatus Binatia bacterium]